MNTIFRSLILQGLSHSGYFINGRLAAYIVFVSFTLIGGLVTADQAVTLIGWLEIIQLLNTAGANRLFDLMEARISVKRIQVCKCIQY